MFPYTQVSLECPYLYACPYSEIMCCVLCEEVRCMTALDCKTVFCGLCMNEESQNVESGTNMFVLWRSI